MSPESLHPLQSQPLLEVRNLEVAYHDIVYAIKGISLSVGQNQVVALFGPNGAGKTSLVRALSQTLQMVDGQIRAGSVHFDGQEISKLPPHEIARRGLYQIPEGGNVIKELTVRENLALSRFCRPSMAGWKEEFDAIFDQFPILKTRQAQLGGLLSGGEQQILSMAKALLAKPKLMVLDEPTLGLAPLLVQENFKTLARLNRELGIAVLVIEQNARIALGIASHGYVIEGGKLVYDAPAQELSSNREIQEFYLGLDGGEKKSFRQVKHYKRRKRWLS